jgi:hypothetical protein
MAAIEPAEFRVRHQEVVGRHRRLRQERDELLSRRQELAVHNRLSGKVTTFASRVRQGIDGLDFEQVQRLVRLLVEEVRVTGSNVQIHVRIPLEEPPPDSGQGRGGPDLQRPPSEMSSHFGLRSLGFDLVQPAGVEGQVVEADAPGMGCEPSLDMWAAMGVQVVEDEVDDLVFSDACVEQIEEVEEDLLGPGRSDHPDDPAGNGQRARR